MSIKKLKKNDNIVQGNMKVDFGDNDLNAESPALNEEVSTDT